MLQPIATLTGGNFRVLVLDEDQALCRTLSRILTENGCQVDCLPLDGKPHLLVRDQPPDLIIIDISMPSSQGLEILRRLESQRQSKKIPIIVTSNQEELEYELLNVFDFLSKPINTKRLMEDIALLTHGPQAQSALPFAPMVERDVQQFQDFLIATSGLHFDQRNHKILERGLMHRMRAVNAPDYPQYFQYLLKYQETRQELKKLLGLLTIGETYFFRYLAHFEALIDRVLPELIARNRSTRTLKLWSAGCSTGEEPYTLAILLLEHFPFLADWNVSILATDINKRSISKAREGIFSGRSLRLTDTRYIDKYFRKAAGSFILDPRVRNMVRFSYLNLQTGKYPSEENGTNSLDLIFCRNVMIYFRVATTRSMVERFAASLRPGGYFFMGHAETLINISDGFQRMQYKGGFYYRRKDAADGLKEPGFPQAPAPAVVLTPAPNPRPLPPPVPPPIAAPEAVPTPTSALEIAAPEIDSLLEQAAAAFNSENFKTASQLYDTILDVCPNQVNAWIGKGFIEANLGHHAEALSCCEKVLHLDDLCAEAYYLRGLIADLEEDLPLAISEYRKALLLDITFIMPYYNLSKIFVRTGKMEDARRQLNNTIRLLEKTRAEVLVPHSGGLSRAVFLEVCREDAARYNGLIATR